MRTLGRRALAAVLILGVVGVVVVLGGLASSPRPAGPTPRQVSEPVAAPGDRAGPARETGKSLAGADEPGGAHDLADRAAEGPPDDPDQFRPGLLAVYRSLAPGGVSETLTRIDLKPAFSMERSSPHPRIAPGPFEVTWIGALEQTTPDSVCFGATVEGEVTVTLDGITVLEGSGHPGSPRLESNESRRWARGFHFLRVVYRSLPGATARLQLWWEGGTFSREPLPAWRLKHDAADLPRAPDLGRDDLAERGRVAAERLGCARCHRSALPGVDAVTPGPSLAGMDRRVDRAWLLRWLEDPPALREGAIMPALFSPDRTGFVERRIVADYLLGDGRPEEKGEESRPGSDRRGRTAFLSLGCAACHPIPDPGRGRPIDEGLSPIGGLRHRMSRRYLSEFLQDPSIRYPDGRMPRLPLAPETAHDLAAYLLDPSPAPPVRQPEGHSVTPQETRAVLDRLGVPDLAAAGRALVEEKRCLQCHPGMGGDPPPPESIPIPEPGGDAARGCLSGGGSPRFMLGPETRRSLIAYLALAGRERYPSPFEAGQRLLQRHGCFRCHRRDADLPSPLEAIGGTIVEHDLRDLPSQRTPRLSYVLSKYRRSYVRTAVREGVKGVRSSRYSYRMPAFGEAADAIVRALAEGDGDRWDEPDPPLVRSADPEMPAAGPDLVGSTGYACVACHAWNGQHLTEAEPGAAGPDLLSLTGRIRRDFFDRWLEDPARVHPRTPMPRIFPKGQPAALATILGGDARKQKDALWAYFALGPTAPSPTSLPPTPIPTPSPGESPLVAQIPIHLPDRSIVEGLCVLYGTHDLLLYDVGRLMLRDLYVGARILRIPRERRSFELEGTPAGSGVAADRPLELVGPGDSRSAPTSSRFLGYDRLADGVRIRTRFDFPSGSVEVAETLRLARGDSPGLLTSLEFSGVPPSSRLEWKTRLLDPARPVALTATLGEASGRPSGPVFVARFVPDAATGSARGTIRQGIPAPAPPRASVAAIAPGVPRGAGSGTDEGTLRRPGYRAIAYPRPKTILGEDLVMPGAMVAHPRDGRLFIASMKMGELFVLRDPDDDGRGARFESFGGGLFQDAYGMAHDGDSLYLLHRRNLTRIRDTDGDGKADAFDRVAALDHGVAENVDNAYGLVRDRSGAFVFTYAVNTPERTPGWGSALRLVPGENPTREEWGSGFRRAFGWCLGPGGEIFFTDNQGEWVATNKLCHLERSKDYGYPNPGRDRPRDDPNGRAAIWVPYGWATSTNGLAYDATGGRFGPFSGQFFLAGWSGRNGIIRAQVEEVNGVYQGACFPFWGGGMLGPLVLAFDPRGRLYVGGITEGTCGGHPDRGALFRIDFTGEVPFEIHSVHALPRGFRLVFTTPVDPRSALDPASYDIEHFRYEYSGEYGSPELDRTRLKVARVEAGGDLRSVDLLTGPLVKGQVYLIQAEGVRSASGEAPVHPAAAYTLNEIPSGDR